MSTLIERLQADIKEQLGRSGERLFNLVEIYGGEFTAAEIKKHSTAAPACLITCLGWSPADKRSHIPKGRAVKLAFFIVTQDTNRTERMLDALALSERLCGWLQDWKCKDELLNGCVGNFHEDSLIAENLYGRASDATGLGLWLVRATIDLSYCTLTQPAVAHNGSMKQFMSTLKTPSITIETNAVTHIDEDDDTPLPNIEQSIDLNGQDIGVK